MSSPLHIALLAAAARAVTIPAACSLTRSCTAQLNAAVAACGTSPCAIALEAGTYVLEGAEYGTRVVINGAQGLSITGAGDATVIVANISTVFSVSDSAGVTFASFAVDMERLPFTYGLVTGVVGTTSTVTFDATSTYAIDLARHPWLDRAQGIITYDPVKERIGKGTDIYALDDPIPITYVQAAGSAATLTMPVALRAGDYVIIRHQTYGYNAFNLNDCLNTAWRNVTLWSVAGMGIYTNEATGLSLDSFRVAKTAGRPMSITADGVHFSNSRGGAISLQNCLFEGQGDDGLNAPTLFQSLTTLSPDRLSLQVSGRGTGPAATPFVRAGDVAQFFDRATLLPLGAVPVTRIGPNNTVVLASPAPVGVAVYSLINSAAQYAASLTVTDTVFRNNRARGALLKSSNVHVSRCVFDGMSASAAKTESDGCFWYEGHPVSNWTFSDNIVHEVNCWAGLADVVIDNSVPASFDPAPSTKCVPYAAAARGAAVQHDLNISGNTFTQISGEPSIGIYSTENVEVRGNTVVREAGTPVPAIDIAGFGVVGAVVDGNVCDGRACVAAGMGA